MRHNMKYKIFLFAFIFVITFLVSCSERNNQKDGTVVDETETVQTEQDKRVIFEAPASIPAEIIEGINRDKTTFLVELDALLQSEPGDLFRLIDKKHFLASDFVPPDLVRLTDTVNEGRSYMINRNDLSLTKGAEASLEEMAAAAREDGVTLLVSSTYRSYEYQDNLYKRNVAQLGQEVADRESARPGTSQHQFGTAIDFGSITDDFAETRAGRWLADNAFKFGWSLSYPDGYENVTGYRWECWHYRYLGRAALDFQRKWFGDVQQYMLEFIHAWKECLAAEEEGFLPAAP